MAPVAEQRYRWQVVLSFFATLMVLAALAVPIVFVAKIDEGLAELDAREGIPRDEAKRRLGV